MAGTLRRRGQSTPCPRPRGDAVTFTQRDLELLCYATRDLMTRRKLGGCPIPPGMAVLDQRLQGAMSARGRELGRAPAQLKHEDILIGATEAATILGCTARHVRRIAADLEGQCVEGVWVFRRQNVVDYAGAKGDGCARD